MSDEFNKMLKDALGSRDLMENSLANLTKLTPQMMDLPRNYTHADWMYERIVRSIDAFEQDLTSDEEVGLRLANFEGVGLIYIDDVGYWNPNIIKFYGSTEVGHRAELLQHTDQLNFLLLALPKLNEQPKRIGFELVKRLEEDPEGDAAK